MRLTCVVTLSWLGAAACAGCGPREPAAGEASVIPGVDTVFSGTTTPANSAAAPASWTPPPDECRYTDARPRPGQGEPEYWQPYDPVVMKRGVEYRCALRPKGPEVRLVVRGEHGIPSAADVHSPADAARPLQRLELENDERARQGSDLVTGEDLNGDGWTDLRMPTFSGTGGVMYDVYLYAPAGRTFVRDTVLSGEGNIRRLAGSPCTETSWRMGGHWSSLSYCWQGGRWIPTRGVSLEPADGAGYVRTRREHRGDSLQAVRIDTVDDPDDARSP
ncbi:XAC2610-related protein [Longimicrobium sp.]|uniref:XAC2610-related protein n=1 Tax=Longimicrobium sp. TaxID=2029185 RepID=UPI003B3AFAEB